MVLTKKRSNKTLKSSLLPATLSKTHVLQASLAKAFGELEPILRGRIAPEPIPQMRISIPVLEGFFATIEEPLENARQKGELSNIWEVAGLGRSEIRTSAALASLWDEGNAGRMSRVFLAEYLTMALPAVNWVAELKHNYQINTECCPIGDRADRVDIIVRTRNHLIAVEVKIDAGEGHRQLERYLTSLGRAGGYQQRHSHVVFLAPFQTRVDGVACTKWSDITAAAERAAGCPVRNRDFSARAISMFGDYVRRF